MIQKEQYAALVFNINKIQNIKDFEIVFQIFDSLFFMHYYLESYNLINKQLSKLEIENDEIIQSQEEIINKTKLFYETFCQKKI